MDSPSMSKDMRLPRGCISPLRLDQWPVPLFLCPVLAKTSSRLPFTSLNERARLFPWHLCKKLHVDSSQPVNHALSNAQDRPEKNSTHSLEPSREVPETSSAQRISPALLNQLPWSCPGCGAYTQLAEPNEAGYYSVTRKSVKAFTKTRRKERGNQEAGKDGVIQEENVPSKIQPINSLQDENGIDWLDVPPPTPICNRCNSLLHHHSGTPIVHPTLQSLQDIFSESPHKHNHIYHVLDAADFPLSLIPQLHKHLALTPQRSHNRRSKTAKYMSSRKAELSFVITRSDLLAPKKEQVDKLMPYLVQVLRDALGSAAKDVRLGNVRCVSAKRGWWTKTLKEDILTRGGGTWMIGKVNVGKSNLFEVVFPKGNGYREDIDLDVLLEEASSIQEFPDDDENTTSELLLLPPPQPFQPYPTMPIVSSLPGTTASPIRLPFSQSRGELIDLPGLPRDDLSPYVLPEHKRSLVMESRIIARQHVIKPGQFLLLGGLIRISLAKISQNSDIVLLAAPFVSLKAHVGLTDKISGVQRQEVESGIESIASPGTGNKSAHAGNFALEWDVTKARSGILTDRKGIGLKTDKLPYVIFSADVLVEGCGWVECTVQVRKKTLEEAKREEERLRRADIRNDGNREGTKEEVGMEYGTQEPKALRPGTPYLEIWSPEGKGIGVRRPMGAYMLGGEGAKPREKTSRPRRSMKGVKKRLKAEGRWKTAA